MLIDLLFPKKCVGCLSSGDYLCPLCVKGLMPAVQTCPVCAKPSIDGMTHNKCLKPLSLNGCLCVWKYQGPIRKAIIVMKYKYAYEIGEVIADKVVFFLLTNDIIKCKNDFVLIPIPAHNRRRKVRGFNQTEVIGKIIAKRMGWQYKNNVLVKNRLTIPQAGLERERRLRNQKDSFKAVGLKGIGKNKQVFLFDDVWTTGATIKEAAKTLRRNGLNNVWGLTIART